MQHRQPIRTERGPARFRVRAAHQPSNSGVWLGWPSGIPNSGSRQFLIWSARAPGRPADSNYWNCQPCTSSDTYDRLEPKTIQKVWQTMTSTALFG